MSARPDRTYAGIHQAGGHQGRLPSPGPPVMIAVELSGDRTIHIRRCCDGLDPVLGEVRVQVKGAARGRPRRQDLTCGSCGALLITLRWKLA